MRQGDEKALCAGCFEWFVDRDLKCTGGHPYCVHCFPSIRVVHGTGAEKAVPSDMMRRRP
jgi:hypothetical protein